MIEYYTSCIFCISASKCSLAWVKSRHGVGLISDLTDIFGLHVEVAGDAVSRPVDVSVVRLLLRFGPSKLFIQLAIAQQNSRSKLQSFFLLVWNTFHAFVFHATAHCYSAHCRVDKMFLLFARLFARLFDVETAVDPHRLGRRSSSSFRPMPNFQESGLALVESFEAAVGVVPRYVHVFSSCRSWKTAPGWRTWQGCRQKLKVAFWAITFSVGSVWISIVAAKFYFELWRLSRQSDECSRKVKLTMSSTGFRSISGSCCRRRCCCCRYVRSNLTAPASCFETLSVNVNESGCC